MYRHMIPFLPVLSAWSRLILCLLSLLALCQCGLLPPTCVSTLPNEIPMGAPRSWVLLHMGGADGKEPWYYDSRDLPRSMAVAAPRCASCRGGCACRPAQSGPCVVQCAHADNCHCQVLATWQQVGEIWHYNDDMSPQGRWMDIGSAWSDPFCSWDLYFDNRGRYVGWRLVEPLSGQRGRERFLTTDYNSKAARLWTQKVNRLVYDYRLHLSYDTKPATLQEASRLTAQELATVPVGFRQRPLVQELMKSAHALGHLDHAERHQTRYYQLREECGQRAQELAEAIKG
jgi:hypothetical protein